MLTISLGSDLQMREKRTITIATRLFVKIKQGELMRRYFVFAGEDYYPKGGMDDFKGCFDNLEEAIYVAEHCEAYGDPWAHVYDTRERVKAWDYWESKRKEQQ
jgi:hypothetical protein